MITQFKFALGDIKSRPLAFILSFVQILCALLMIALSCYVLDNTFVYKNKFEIFHDTSKMYFICDNTSDKDFNKLWSDEVNSEKKCYEFYSFINSNNDYVCYSFSPNMMTLEAKNPMDTADYIDNDIGAVYKTLKINKNFINFYNLQCESGSLFSNFDYKASQKKTPVVLGYNYKKYYSLGDEIIKDYIVIGFLNEKSFYLDPKSCNEVLYLDDTIILPMVINEKTDFTDFDTAIMSTTVIINDEEKLDLIKEKSAELNLYDISFRSYTEQLQRIVKEAFRTIFAILLIVFLVLFFCVVCLISSLLNFIETHKREFAVHMLCGAKKADFILRIIWQIAVIVIIGDIVTLTIFRFSFPFIGTSIISVILLLIITALPVIKIRNQSVNELLKRSE